MAYKRTSRPVTIYGLASSIDGQVRYVGQTVRELKTRLRDHLNCARKGKEIAVYAWIRKHEALGETIQIKVLEENAIINESEIRWIANLRAAGVKLVNSTKGGDGIVGQIRTPEHQEKIAAAQRGQKRKPLSTEQKQVLSEILKKRSFSPEHRRRISETRKAQGISQEAQEKMRLGRVSSDKWRSNCGRKSKQFSSTPMEGLL